MESISVEVTPSISVILNKAFIKEKSVKREKKLTSLDKISPIKVIQDEDTFIQILNF